MNISKVNKVICYELKNKNDMGGVVVCSEELKARFTMILNLITRCKNKEGRKIN